MTKLIYHPFVIAIITLVAIIFFVSLEKSSKKTELSTKNIEILEKEVSQMSNKVMETEEKIVKADSEESKEKIIRNELLLQKPGEYIIQLPNLENKDNSNSENHNDDKPIDKWLKLFL